MPDLNLIDEGGFEDVPEAPAAPPTKKSVKEAAEGAEKLFCLLLWVCAF